MPDTIAILDFGSQYSQLIARKVREQHVYSELFPWDTPAERVLALNPKGFILSGGPASVYAPQAPRPDPGIFGLRIPVLGICYGVQLFAHYLNGKVEPGAKRVVTFLRSPAPPDLVLPVPRDGVHIRAARDREVFTTYVPHPSGPRFMIELERAFGVDQTTRTWDSLRKCLAAAG